MSSIITAVILVTAIGLACALILVIASHFMSVREDERQSQIRACLPGANCGACGFAGCDQYAKALVEKPGTATNLCVPGADAVSRQISTIMGVDFQDVVEHVAIVRCQGDCRVTAPKMVADGVTTCAGANLLFGGKGQCVYGCLGYGDCAKVCPNQAICLTDGIARIDTRKCTGCGLCTKTCPKHIITLIPDIETVTVACSNGEKGALARSHCKKACIACKKCESVCPTGAIHVEGNCASIDFSKCSHCGACVRACPDQCIVISDNSGIHRMTEATPDTENPKSEQA